MATLNIFVSAEFDRDNELKNHFLALAKEKIPHRVRDCSLHEPYPDERWKSKARKAIRDCDVVVVLIGQDTHSAPGVKVETDMARSFDKPTIQIRPKPRPQKGLNHLEEPIRWDWKEINRKLDEI